MAGAAGETKVKKKEEDKEPQKRTKTRLESLAKMYLASKTEQAEEGAEEEEG
ncbi:hypothetical protein ES703_66445 [subsurface metagenome]